jgi:hypothetical protein
VLALTAEDDTDTSLGARLLADLREVFADADAMHGETILAALHKVTEAPWADYYGKPLAARDMAKLLKPYGVASVDVKIDGTNRKGYRREHLHDPWVRYLPAKSATSATSATAHASAPGQVAGSGQQALPATSDTPRTCGVAQVAHVAGSTGAFDCTVCGEPIDAVIAAAGMTTHPDCDPIGGWAPGTYGAEANQ